MTQRKTKATPGAKAFWKDDPDGAAELVQIAVRVPKRLYDEMEDKVRKRGFRRTSEMLRIALIESGVIPRREVMREALAKYPTSTGRNGIKLIGPRKPPQRETGSGTRRSKTR